MLKPKKAKRKTAVDVWISRETPHVREALENASRYFGRGDALTVNTLEAIYGQESSFGVLLRKRGMGGAAGHFHIEKATAEQYGLIANAQRLAQEAGKDPTSWNDVQAFLEAAGATETAARDGRKYVPNVLKNEVEFAKKSIADKKVKNKRPGKMAGRCTKGHWITKDHHHIFICD